MKNLMRNKILCSFKVSTYQVLINYKEERSNFVEGKPGRHHLKLVIRVNIISNDINRNHMPPDRIS